MGFFDKIKQGLAKTRNSLVNNINSVLNSFTKIDEELFEELEEVLISSDVGVATACEICDRMRARIKAEGIKDPAVIKDCIKEIISDK